jgi:membrane protein YqaA with SNARE-associated domain
MLMALFFSALVSATLLPGSSEVALVAALSQHSSDAMVLVTVATLGNVLGALVTFAMGWYGQRWSAWQPSLERQTQVMPYIQRFGWLTLLLSWIPLFGDALCLMAGWLRLPLLRCALAMTLGKLFRYLSVMWLYQLSVPLF